jgi:hypothetical protein
MSEINCQALFNSLPPLVKATLRPLADKVKAQDVILFLGAATHVCAPDDYNQYCIDADIKEIYGDAHRPPIGNELAKSLANEIDYREIFPEESQFTLGRIAQYYEITGGRDSLVNFLQEQIDNKLPSPIIYALADLPFKYILTTNYDTLFEDALVSRGKSIKNKGIYHPNKNSKTVTTDFEESSVTENSPFIYKMHGDIKDSKHGEMDVSDDADLDSIVLTDEDYIHFILRMNDKDIYNPIPFSFTKAFGKKSILFIGYSLLDYNLRLLLKSTMWGKDIRNRIKNWAINKYPDDVIVWLSDPYSIKFVVEDSWKIIPALYWLIKEKNMPLTWNQ